MFLRPRNRIFYPKSRYPKRRIFLKRRGLSPTFEWFLLLYYLNLFSLQDFFFIYDECFNYHKTFIYDKTFYNPLRFLYGVESILNAFLFDSHVCLKQVFVLMFSDVFLFVVGLNLWVFIFCWKFFGFFFIWIRFFDLFLTLLNFFSNINLWVVRWLIDIDEFFFRTFTVVWWFLKFWLMFHICRSFNGYNFIKFRFLYSSLFFWFLHCFAVNFTIFYNLLVGLIEYLTELGIFLYCRWLFNLFKRILLIGDNFLRLCHYIYRNCPTY